MSESNTASIPVQDTGVLAERPQRRPDGPSAGPNGTAAAGGGTGEDTTARSSAIMAAGTLVSRLLGLIRVALLATAIGTLGQVSDLFPAANNLPNFIYLMVAGGVFNAVLVPQIIKASRKEDRGADYISRLITLAACGLLVLTVLATLAAPFIADLVSNVSGARLALVTTFAYWCLPQIFFYGLYAIIGQVLNANGSFGPYTWAPVVNNVISIGFLTAFIVVLGPESTAGHTPENWTLTHTLLLAGGTTLGIVVQALVLFLPLRKLGLGLSPRFGWRGVGFGQTGKLASVTIITMLVGNGLYLVNQWVATIATEARADYASRKPPQPIAGLANLEIGSLVYVLPHSVIAVSLATVLFNQLAAAHADNNLAALRDTLSRGLRTIGVATVFGAAALLTLAVPLGMLFSGGSQASGAINAVIIALLALGAPFLSANFFLNRVFYAREDVVTPLKIQLILSVLGVALALTAGAFRPDLIVPMLAVGYSVGNVVAVAVSHFFLRRTIGRYGAGHIFDVHVRLTVAGIAAAAGGSALLWLAGAYRPDGFVWQSVLHSTAVLIVGGTVMALIYLAALRALKVSELSEFLSPLLARFKR
ncbi:murein biosynthesis integral membrane protein MurJ [Arthrobacter crusticola]|uniref:Murein biosynthesis integral membrane protein MurJ n=1 Tax=Arthrobacter crusticola TaxID=2547960 RepID=A0A4R5TU95_9MICC|nr:murein biosynthesis integral membrane protein MurJ [Arthrobacter crusticola]TDK24599.1 murein biosynthesis integral membrane protein MurJ [Arthrobacter crusticola]